MEYYYTDTYNQAQGPISIEQLRSLADTGFLNSSCMVCRVGDQQWGPIGMVIPTIAPAPSTGTEPLAIWSLVLSVLGLSCCGMGILLAIPGVICGHLALGRMRRNPHLQGKGLATAGVIVGYVVGVIWIGVVAVQIIAAIMNNG